MLDVSGIVMTFGGVRALDGASFAVDQGVICGLIGPNGAGKTTLFNCVTRIYQPNQGSIRFDSTDLLRVPRSRVAKLGIARTFQNIGLIPHLSVLDNVALGGHIRSGGGFISSPLWLPHVLREERTLRQEAATLLERLGLVHVGNERPDALAFGTLKRIELARALMIRPRLLLLDEPACGLNHNEVKELSSLIVELRDEFRFTVLLVEHHMAMVMAIADRVVVLDLGKTIADGTAGEVQSNPDVIAAYLGTPA